MVRHSTDIRRCEAGTLCGFTPSVLQYSTTSSKTASSVQMVSDGVQKLNDNIKLVNADFSIDLESCMTGQVESLHSTHHHKHEAGAHVIDYARGFGNPVKEGLKRTTLWAAHYFTNKKTYYPVPSNSVRFWDIPFLPPLPTVQMNDQDQECMREWARHNGKVYVSGRFDRKSRSTRQALFP